MADYIVNTDEKRRQMLDAVGIRDINKLLCDIPDNVRLKRPLNIPEAYRAGGFKANFNYATNKITAHIPGRGGVPPLYTGVVTGLPKGGFLTCKPYHRD
jgi:glycine cleavage system pyridoxal-binding protein P